MNKSHGIEGLLEIKKIRDLCKARNISLEFTEPDQQLKKLDWLNMEELML